MTEPTFIVLILEDCRKSNRLQMFLQRQHFLLCYFKTQSVGPSWKNGETFFKEETFVRSKKIEGTQPATD